MDTVDTPAASERREFFVVRETHRPQQGQDLGARALFLTAGLGILCSRLLKLYLDHCESDGKKAEPAIKMEEYTACVKELLSISIWLVLFEQIGNDVPEWFKDFTVNCHSIADKVQPQPTAKDIQSRYALGSPIADICMQLSINLCMQLRLGATTNDAMLYLGELVLRAKPERNELLEFALTQPLTSLDERIKQS